MVPGMGLKAMAGVVLLTVLAASPAVGLSRKPSEPSYVPGQVILKFQDDVSRERAMDIIAAEGCTVMKVLKRSGLHLVTLPADRKVLSAVDSFSAYPEVLYAEPNYQTAQPLGEQ